MVRQSAPSSYLLGPKRFSDKQVEQAVSMKMTDFCRSDKKADTAKPVWAPLHSVFDVDSVLEPLHCAKPRPIKQHCRSHQPGIEQFGQDGYSRQPSYFTVVKFETHRAYSYHFLNFHITR